MTATSERLGQIEQVAEGVYAYVQPDGGWCVNNAGVVVSGGESAVIDTAATERRALGLKAAATTVGAGRPSVLVNTHHHSDHTFGNVFFAPETLIVANEPTRAGIIENGLNLQQLWRDVEWGAVGVRPPVVTFEESLTVRIGGLRLELITVGPAHTVADTVVWIPQRRVLFTGDVVMSEVTPFTLMGSISGSVAALETLRRLDPAVVVPGHGPVAGPEVIDANLAYFHRIRDLVAGGAGRTPLEIAAAAGAGPFAGWLDSERLVPNIRRGLAEAQGLPPGVPLDILEAFGEMVTFTGAAPACHA